MTYLKAKHLLPALLLIQIFSFDTKVKLESFSCVVYVFLNLLFLVVIMLYVLAVTP